MSHVSSSRQRRDRISTQKCTKKTRMRLAASSDLQETNPMNGKKNRNRCFFIFDVRNSILDLKICPLAGNST